MIHMRMRQRISRSDELEPIPEVGDHYREAEILLPRENRRAKGHVVASSCDTNGNVMGRACTKPILILECIMLSLQGAKLQN